MSCQCQSEKPDVEYASDLPAIVTLRAEDVSALHSSLSTLATQSELASISAVGSAQRSLPTEFHVVPGVGSFATLSAERDFSFATILTGAIGGIPVQLELSGELDIEAHKIRVGLRMLKPFQSQKYTWTFNLGGLRRLENGAYFATSVTLDEANTSELSALGLDWWCVARCGGTAILGILIRCLPSLAGGPAAYVACVTAQAGSGAAGIAACIASRCT